MNGDIDVELTFENDIKEKNTEEKTKESKKESLSKNGTLKSIVCKYENSIFFSTQKVNDQWETKYDFLVVKKKFFEFMNEAK